MLSCHIKIIICTKRGFCKGTDFSANNPIATRSIFGYNTSGTANSVTVGSTAKVYDIVLFIKNKDESQNYDQDKSYSGTIVVSSTEEGAGKIYGQIEGVTG